MKSGFYIYDTHTHLGTARHSGRRYTVDQMLRDMDRQGVDRAMAIPFPVVDNHREQHDEIGRAVLAHPDRLHGAACLYPYIPESEFRDEVRRCRELYGFRALKFQPQYHAMNPIWKSTELLYSSAVENGMAMIAHTGSGVPYSLPSLFMLPARNFPDLRIVLAHCGGGGVYMHEAIVAAQFCPNIYLELSSLMPHQVLETLTHVPSSRLMAGSDLPESQETELGKILTLDVPDDDKRNMLGATGLRVFGE